MSWVGALGGRLLECVELAIVSAVTAWGLRRVRARRMRRAGLDEGDISLRLRALKAFDDRDVPRDRLVAAQVLVEVDDTLRRLYDPDRRRPLGLALAGSLLLIGIVGLVWTSWLPGVFVPLSLIAFVAHVQDWVTRWRIRELTRYEARISASLG